MIASVQELYDLAGTNYYNPYWGYQSGEKRNKVKKKEPFNPMYEFYKKGFGTTAYRDAWGLFDQVIISEGLLNPSDNGYRYYKANVFNKSFLIQKMGQYKGYPNRTFVGDDYRGGYSDHLPVYVFLVKES